jgi:hypothetical protein
MRGAGGLIEHFDPASQTQLAQRRRIFPFPPGNAFSASENAVVKTLSMMAEGHSPARGCPEFRERFARPYVFRFVASLVCLVLGSRTTGPSLGVETALMFFWPLRPAEAIFQPVLPSPVVLLPGGPCNFHIIGMGPVFPGAGIDLSGATPKRPGARSHLPAACHRRQLPSPRSRGRGGVPEGSRIT